MDEQRRWLVNDDVMTPMGKGVVQGWMRLDDEEAPRVMVRLRGVPGRAVKECLTPRAKYSSLWLFFPGELERAK